MNVIYVVVSVLIALGVILIRWSIKKNKLTKEQSKEGLRFLREFTEHGSKITSWFKEHVDELQRWPVETLNQRELIGMIREDQELYDRIIKIYPDYECMPPTELHQYLIEIAQGKHKSIH
ncbi:MAG: hypothetical protein A2915_04150 [Candidatus Yanofskybacteria bacterium RIFCSPLOWO2_01_FULL_41_34]|uniref:Uncharacterized protein n=1 Tax=Candidatus Yanofskybacteria bacterium RIFCSPHIGHO2_01_FULL_41_26 TaxID=1802661 RepID=A0A1F8EC10_9BACT|nr:MAG: hypothetical protein A2649_03250 [Candidatus Yanofskybacteria bacterium RIFCSPHIGHO2_01_FULL_41_26]OGN21600.1 MAG: hypothetical protein A2915_04150 [Candidatus Yanofskybacteria bacterium RIFCSPLOWO2_01_FULL_41_34]